MRILLIMVCLSLASCFPELRYTASGRLRLVHKKDFQYSRSKYANGQRAKLDFGAVYLELFRVQWGDTLRQDHGPRSQYFYRFFAGGQMLRFDTLDGAVRNQANDSEAGVPGYYAVSGNRLRFETWTNIMGDQTPRHYGFLLDDSTLKLYETYVPDCLGSWNCLERKNNFSIWRRQHLPDLRSYRPNW